MVFAFRRECTSATGVCQYYCTGNFAAFAFNVIGGLGECAAQGYDVVNENIRFSWFHGSIKLGPRHKSIHRP